MDSANYGLEMCVENDKTLTVGLVNDLKRVKKLCGPYDTLEEIRTSLGYVQGFTRWWPMPVYFSFTGAPSQGCGFKLGICDAQGETEERRVDGRLAPWRSWMDWLK